MEFLRDLPPGIIPISLILVNFLVLLTMMRTDKSHVRWNRLIQLAILDTAVL